jgi:hypothetical protein
MTIVIDGKSWKETSFFSRQYILILSTFDFQVLPMQEREKESEPTSNGSEGIEKREIE